MDSIAPLGGVSQAVARDLQSVGASPPVKIGVVPIPLPASAKLYYGKIPRNHHWNYPLFTRLQSEAHRDRSGQLFAAANPALIAVGKPAIAGKKFPDIASLRVFRKVGRLIRDLD